MRLRPMKLTVKILKKRLEMYPASALRDVLRALKTIEARRGIDYQQSEEERTAVQKELIIGEYREMHVSEAEIAELLKRAGL